MARKYSAKLIAKYTRIAKKLEEVFVVSKPEIFFNFRQFLKDESASDCLMTMLIRRGYIARIDKSKFQLLQAHPFQSMARNPVEMLELITDYNTSQKFVRSDKANRAVEVPSEPEYMESPFEEETETPLPLSLEMQSLAIDSIEGYLHSTAIARVREKFEEAHRCLKRIFKGSNAGLNIDGKNHLLTDLFNNYDIRKLLADDLYTEAIPIVRRNITDAFEEIIKRKEDNTDGKEN